MPTRLPARLAVLVGITLLPIGPLAAQNAYPVGDLGAEVPFQYEEYFGPAEHLTAGDLFFSFLDDGIHGRELWRSDGTAIGTFLIRDVCPGSCGSRASWLGLLAPLGERVLFTANDGVHGLELWISDGTALGTNLVADLLPGYDSSVPHLLTAASDQVFFLAFRDEAKTALWRSDGTAKGTYVVAPVDPLQSFAPSSIFAASGRLFLCNGVLGRQGGLWTSDGTSIGTQFVAEVGCQFDNGFGKGRAAAVAGNVFYFAGNTSSGGTDLWRSDGTPVGTFPVKDLHPGYQYSQFYSFALRGNDLLFRADGPVGPGELWRSDGTDAGTVPIPLADGASPHLSSGTWAVAGSNYYFAAEDPGHGLEPWVYDGVDAHRIADLVAGPDSSITFEYIGLNAAIFEPFGDELVFAADDGVFGREIWRSNGETPGTVRISDLVPGAGGIRFPYYWTRYFANLGGRPLFLEHQPEVGLRLWRLGPSGSSVDLVRLVDGQTSLFETRATDRHFLLETSRAVDCFAAVGERLAFEEHLPETSRQNLLSTNGALDAVELVIPNSIYGESPCAAVDGRLAYSRVQELPANEAVLDSVNLETGEVDPLLVGPGLSLYGIPPFVQAGAGLAFLSESTLFESDGTPDATTQLATDVGDWGARLEPFLGEIVIAGTSLSMTDPRENDGARTLLEGDFTSLYVEPQTAALGPLLVFPAWDPIHGTEIWASDGSESGTGLLVDTVPGPGSLYRGLLIDRIADFREPQLVSAGLFAVFAGRTAPAGEELWVTDGSALGTQLLKDIYTGDLPSAPRQFTRLGDRVLFTAESELEGLELWATDGTFAGTVLVKDIAPGAASSVPDDLTAVDGVLYFSAWSPTYGREAWKSDGTSAGTIRITDIAPGSKSSSPQRFARAGNRLYFSATDHVHGYELWAISDDGGIPLFLDGFESGSTSRWNATEPATP